MPDTTQTAEESRALLERVIISSTSTNEIVLYNHLRAALDREAALTAERDAALARHGGLSVAHQKVLATANEQFHRANKLQAERDAMLSHQPVISRRERIATAALNGMLSHSTRYRQRPEDTWLHWHAAISREAVQLADALIAALDEGARHDHHMGP